MLSTNEASRRDTPCASATPSRTASAAIASPVNRRRRRLFNGHLVLSVAVVARVVQPLAGRENRFGILLLRGSTRFGGGCAHGRRDHDPVARVARSPAGLQQLGRLDDRGGVARHPRPLAI